MNFKFFLFIILTTNLYYSQNRVKIHTLDIDNFWTAYDSIKKTNDTEKQVDIIQKLPVVHY
jgi:hypothetical protein